MNRKDAESVYRDYSGDWYKDYEMLSGIAHMTHRTYSELEDSWLKCRREWAVTMLMDGEGDYEGVTRPLKEVAR